MERQLQGSCGEITSVALSPAGTTTMAPSTIPGTGTGGRLLPTIARIVTT